MLATTPVDGARERRRRLVHCASLSRVLCLFITFPEACFQRTRNLIRCAPLRGVGLVRAQAKASGTGGTLDGNAFDSVVREAVSGTSRRGLVRAGLGGLGLSGLGLLMAKNDGAASSKKRRKKKKRCKSDRPVKCGGGCCPSQYPQCCESASNPDPSTRYSCNPTSYTCCSTADGGGSCPTDTKCCPPTAMVGNEFGSCAPKADSVCCPANTLYDWCPTDLPICCNQDCCADGEACCDAEGNCPDGFECVGDCCVIVAGLAGRRAGARSQQPHGRSRFVMPAR
jgi:hypothetical protein